MQKFNSTDVPPFKKFGFDGEKYLRLQKEKILDRISNFSGGRLYLEIGGKFMSDPHAARVLPGFHAESKKQIFVSLKDQVEILFCVKAQDIIDNRQLSSQHTDFKTYVRHMLRNIEMNIGIRPHVVINAIDVENMFDVVLDFEKEFQRKNYRVWERYKINGYPNNIHNILSEEGFGKDDHIPLTKNLILVTGAASNSGKMSTCLGQIYMDHEIGVKSGYAKYETFPIRNLPLNHPVNLAYEAATADCGDYNAMDVLHKKAYKIDAVNYNRDIEAFPIVMDIAKKIVTHKNYMVKYQSPTDMGINCAGMAITNDEIVSVAALQEIMRRKVRYNEMIARGDGKQERATACEKFQAKAMEYCNMKKYDTNIVLY